jgi:hypothetical protein
MAMAQYRLALLYEEQGIQEEKAKELKEDARMVLALFQNYTVKWIRETGDEMAILESLQPTFGGRYTGRNLLKYIQDHHRSRSRTMAALGGS